MNRIFGIVLVLLFLTSAPPADARLFERKTIQPDYIMDFDEVKLIDPIPEQFKSPDIPDVPQDNPVLEGGATVGNESDSVDKEDVDLDAIDDELPENNSELLPRYDQNDLENKHETSVFKRIFDIDNNIEAEFSLFDNFDLDKNNDGKIDENTFIGKILNQDISRTDIPSYLMKKQLTFRPKKGIVSKVQYYGAFQGDFSSTFLGSDYDTSYDIGFLQFGAIGKFRNTKNDFKILFNPRPANGRTYMQNFIADAYIINSSIPHHKLVVGYSRNQVGKEGGSSSYILPFVIRSQIARNFGSTRALGVRLIGNYSLMDYNLAFNSSDRYFHTPFAGPEFTGWIDFKPLGKTDGRYGNLTFGGGINAGHNRTNYTVGSFYVGYKYKRLWTNFEYGIADGYNGTYVSTNKAQGFNYTIGYKIHPKVQLIARYDQFDPNRDVAHDTRREYTAGINYFIKGQAIRLILNYVFCNNQNSSDSHRIIVGTQLLL